MSGPAATDATSIEPPDEQAARAVALFDYLRERLLVLDAAGRCLARTAAAEELEPPGGDGSGPAPTLPLGTETERRNALAATRSAGGWAGLLAGTGGGSPAWSRWGRARSTDDDDLIAVLLTPWRSPSPAYDAQRLEVLTIEARAVGHDLNNILATLPLTVSLLRDGARSDQRSLLAGVEEGARRGIRTVRELHGFAKATDGASCTLAAERLVSSLRHAQDLFPELGTLDAGAVEPSLAVVADPVELHQLLVNLWLHCRHLARDATLDLRLTSEGGFVRLSLGPAASERPPAGTAVPPVFDAAALEGRELRLVAMAATAARLGGELRQRPGDPAPTYDLRLPAR